MRRSRAQVLEDVARPDNSGLLRDAADAMRLSARGYHRVLRVARTLADLDGADKVGRVHLAEALSYRAHYANLRKAIAISDVRLSYRSPIAQSEDTGWSDETQFPIGRRRRRNRFR